MSTYRNKRPRRVSVIEIRDSTVCHYCKSTGLQETEKECPNCGFPQGGTQGEMKYYISRMARKKEYLSDQKKNLQRAQLILFAIGGLNFITVAVQYYNWRIFDPWIMAEPLFLGLAFTGLGAWSTKKPYPAIITGLVLYGLLWLLGAIVSPVTIFSGLIIRIFIVTGLVVGFKSAREYKRLQNEIDKTKNPRDLQNGSLESFDTLNLNEEIIH